MIRRLSSLLFVLAVVGCGIVEDTPSEDSPEEADPWAFLRSQEPVEIPETECINDDKKLSEERCDGELRRVFVCENGTWQSTDSCASPDECTPGAREPLEGHCGGQYYWFNTRYRECRGGVWQETCACGAAEPHEYTSPYVGEITDAEGVARLQGVSFPFTVYSEYSGLGYLDHVRCTGSLVLIGSEPSGLTGLFGALGVFVEGTYTRTGVLNPNTEGLNLRYANGIQISNISAESLPGFSQVEEVRESLSLLRSDLSDFRSFSGLQRVGSIFIVEGDKMLSLSGLSGISHLEYFTFTGTESRSLSSLEGLENLERVERDLKIVGTSLEAEDLKTLGNLTSVGGDLIISLNPRLSDCEVRQALSHVEVAGKIELVNNRYGCDCPEEFCE